jgi:hypothetical protein
MKIVHGAANRRGRVYLWFRLRDKKGKFGFGVFLGPRQRHTSESINRFLQSAFRETFIDKLIDSGGVVPIPFVY